MNIAKGFTTVEEQMKPFAASIPNQSQMLANAQSLLQQPLSQQNFGQFAQLLELMSKAQQIPAGASQQQPIQLQLQNQQGSFIRKAGSVQKPSPPPLMLPSPVVELGNLPVASGFVGAGVLARGGGVTHVKIGRAHV